MLAKILLQPKLHGQFGPWDEVINLTPLVLGILLLAYMYIVSRKRRRQASGRQDDAPADEDRLPKA